jgi:SAM-dependent methyltransferase
MERRAEIARSLAALAGVAPGDVLLELGAGTGQLGACFPELGVRYVGLDASQPMLDVFERRLRGAHAAATLIRTDVNAEWPVASASVRAVFSSRAAHLFAREHVVAETLRVAHGTGCAFVLGRVQRDETGLRDVLRRQMRAMLAARGFEPRDGAGGQRRMLDAFRAGGATPVGPLVAARWPVRASVASVLDDWRGKPGIGGCELPEDEKAALLGDLEAWAARRYESPHASEDAEQRYILEGVALAARRSPAETDGTA